MPVRPRQRAGLEAQVCEPDLRTCFLARVGSPDDFVAIMQKALADT
jgi:hypothetical protein